MTPRLVLWKANIRKYSSNITQDVQKLMKILQGSANSLVDVEIFRIIMDVLKRRTPISEDLLKLMDILKDHCQRLDCWRSGKKYKLPSEDSNEK